MYNCFRFFAHSPEWNVIHQSGFLGWLLTPVKQDPAVVQEFPIYIQIGLKASDMYLDLPVCAINTVLFLVLFGLGSYLVSFGIKSRSWRTMGIILILAGLGWYFTLRNYCGNYYSATFIIKVVYTLVALAFAGIGFAIGNHKRNAIDAAKVE
jgi:hypothetical protein